MKKRGTYKKREQLSTGWVIFGVITMLFWVTLFLAPIWGPAVGLK